MGNLRSKRRLVVNSQPGHFTHLIGICVGTRWMFWTQIKPLMLLPEIKLFLVQPGYRLVTILSHLANVQYYELIHQPRNSLYKIFFYFNTCTVYSLLYIIQPAKAQL